MPALECDVNCCRSFVRDAVRANLGEPGCLSIYGSKTAEHAGLDEHCTAEEPVTTEHRAAGSTSGECGGHAPVLDATNGSLLHECTDCRRRFRSKNGRVFERR